MDVCFGVAVKTLSSRSSLIGTDQNRMDDDEDVTPIDLHSLRDSLLLNKTIYLYGCPPRTFFAFFKLAISWGSKIPEFWWLFVGFFSFLCGLRQTGPFESEPIEMERQTETSLWYSLTFGLLMVISLVVYHAEDTCSPFVSAEHKSKSYFIFRQPNWTDIKLWSSINKKS